MKDEIRCVFCRYYSDDCGYWSKEYRKTHRGYNDKLLNKSSFVSEECLHGCKDFIRDDVKYHNYKEKK